MIEKFQISKSLLAVVLLVLFASIVWNDKALVRANMCANNDIADRQRGANYKLCNGLLPADINSRAIKASWCDKVNTKSSVHNSLKDNDFNNNCGDPRSRCIQNTLPPAKETCLPNVIDDSVKVNGGNATDDYRQLCRVTQHAIPFEVATGTTDEKQEYLLVATNSGFSIVNFKTEKVAAQSATPFEYVDVISVDWKKFGFIIGVSGKTLISYEFVPAVDGNTIKLTKKSQVPLTNDISDLKVFKKENGKVWVQLQEKASKSLIFYPIDANGVVETASKLVWSFANIQNVKRIDAIPYRVKEFAGANPARIGCYPSKTKSVVIIISTNFRVYVIGSPISSKTIDLNPAQNFKYLVYKETEGSITANNVITECFGDKTGKNKLPWLALGVTKTDGVNILKFVPMKEISQMDALSSNDPVSTDAPTFFKKNGATFTPVSITMKTCYLNKEYVNTNGNCLGRIISGEVILRDAATEIQSGLIYPNEETNSKVNNVDQIYMNQVFVANNKQILVVGFQEIACEELSAANKPKIDEFNRIQLTNRVNNLHVSANGQHIFSSVLKTRWEIKAMQDLADACSSIRSNPSNTKYLESLKAECEKKYYGKLDAYDYIRYYSQCSGSFYCPLMGNVLNPNQVENSLSFEKVPAEQHTVRPTAKFDCEPGFYCPGVENSKRRKCPVGFICPTAKMTIPQKCEPGKKFETACINEAQANVVECPKGHICANPSNPRPAPPGYFVEKNDRKTLYKCSPGQYCPVGTGVERKELAPSLLTCPLGSYCADPSVLLPKACNSTDSETSRSNYCPLRSTQANLCPGGFYCPNTTMIAPCEDGYFCPAGTSEPVPCPKGYYCPTPAAFLTCPKGHYCRQGTINPVKCQILVFCPEGTGDPKYAFGAIFVDVFLLVLVLIIYVIAKCVQRQIRKKREKKRKKMEKEQFLSQLNEGFSAGQTVAAHAGVMDELISDGLSLQQKAFTMDYKFRDLSFIRKKNNRIIFSGLTGSIKHGAVTAIISPSKEASRSLLHSLSGVGYYGYISGSVHVNDEIFEPKKLNSFKNIVGVVPERPIIHEELKVKELFRFSAHLKLPRSTTFSQVTRKVKRTGKVLGLEKFMNDIVGKKEKFGFGAAERKLVGIGMEVVAEPTALFLEFPTSGIDTKSSLRIMKVLKEISQSGVTVVAAVERPSYEVFKNFDDVVLLGSDAETSGIVYNGPAEECVNYFDELGFKCPSYANPTDYVLSVIQGQVRRPGDLSFKPSKLLSFWDMKKGDSSKPWSEKSVEEGDDENEPKILDAEAQITMKQRNKERKRKRSDVFGQFFIFFFRSILINLRHFKGWLFDFVFTFMLASLLGAFYFNLEFVGPVSESLQKQCPPLVRDLCELPRRDNVGELLLLTSATLAILACYTSLKPFGDNKPVMKREFTQGIHKISFFLGTMTSQLFYMILLPFIFLSVWYLLTSPRAIFPVYYGIFVLIYFTWSGLAYFVSLVIQRVHAQFVCVLFILISSMLGGLSPTAAVLQSSWYTAPFSYLSPIRWCFELLYLVELRKYELEGEKVQSAMKYLGFAHWHVWLAVAMLLLYGVLVRLLTYFAFFTMDPVYIDILKSAYEGCFKRYASKIKKAKTNRNNKRRATTIKLDNDEYDEIEDEEAPSEVQDPTPSQYKPPISSQLIADDNEENEDEENELL